MGDETQTLFHDRLELQTGHLELGAHALAREIERFRMFAGRPGARLDDGLIRRLLSREFEELRHLFGYFHQDWMDDYEDDDEVVRQYLRDHEHRPQDVVAPIEGMDALLAFAMSDEELKAALEVLGSAFVPSPTTAWLRSLREKLATWVSNRE